MAWPSATIDPVSRRVVITRKPSGSAVTKIAEAADVWVWPHDRAIDRDVLLRRIGDAHGLYCMLTDRIDRTVIESAPDLRVISTMAVGVDNIDTDAARNLGVAVGHTPDVLTESTADLAWTLIMAASRRVLEGIDTVREGRWGEWDPEWMLGLDVSRTTLGIVGMGRIGRALVERAAGFDMTVLYASRSAHTVDARRVDLDELLALADHVVVAVPLTRETHRLIGRDELARMKPTATLVNIARGPVVDSDALAAALRTGTIRAAALDVTDPEPIPPDHPLVGLPNCLIVPHIGSATRRTRDAMANLAADNLIAGLHGDPMPARYA